MAYSLKKVGKGRELYLASTSLVGVGGLHYPLSSGNYFSVHYRGAELPIVNMCAENFRHLEGTKWTIYSVIDEQGRDSGGYLLYSKRLDPQWYLRRPHTYNTAIPDGAEFETSRGFDVSEPREPIDRYGIGDFLDELFGTAFAVEFSCGYSEFSDFAHMQGEEGVVFYEALSLPYEFWAYDYRSLEMNLDSQGSISRISFFADRARKVYVIREQKVDALVARLNEIRDFRKFKKDVKNLRPDGEKALFELAKREGLL